MPRVKSREVCSEGAETWVVGPERAVNADNTECTGLFYVLNFILAYCLLFHQMIVQNGNQQ